MPSRPVVIRTYRSSGQRNNAGPAVRFIPELEDATSSSQYNTAQPCSSSAMHTSLPTCHSDMTSPVSENKQSFDDDEAISFPAYPTPHIVSRGDAKYPYKRDRTRSASPPTTSSPSFSHPNPTAAPTQTPGATSKQSSLKNFFIPRPPTILSVRTAGKTGDNFSAVADIAKATTTTTTTTTTTQTTRKPLHQLHLVPSRHNPTSTQSRSSLYITCPLCSMSYIRGGIGEDDELIHKRHCERVTKGVIWTSGMGGQVVARDVKIGKESGSKQGHVGHIVKIDGRNIRTNRKVMEILESVNTVLSSPALPQSMLSKCKIYLFVTCSSPPILPTNKRPKSSLQTKKAKSVDRVVGCVVAQPIKVGMKVVQNPGDGNVSVKDCVIVDHGSQGDGTEGQGGVICYPERLPTKLGIHRLFVIPAYRGLGIAIATLDTACRFTVYGIHCDPIQGHVAFSQPTSSGKAVMDRWGDGAVRVFIEDEQEDE